MKLWNLLLLVAITACGAPPPEPDFSVFSNSDSVIEESGLDQPSPIPGEEIKENSSDTELNPLEDIDDDESIDDLDGENPLDSDDGDSQDSGEELEEILDTRVTQSEIIDANGNNLMLKDLFGKSKYLVMSLFGTRCTSCNRVSEEIDRDRALFSQLDSPKCQYSAVIRQQLGSAIKNPAKFWESTYPNFVGSRSYLRGEEFFLRLLAPLPSVYVIERNGNVYAVLTVEDAVERYCAN